MLPITDGVVILADALIRRRALPTNAQNDAIHIDVSTVHGVDYLLTWNFRHLANAETRPFVREICEQLGYAIPEICTPSELMGGEDVLDLYAEPYDLPAGGVLRRDLYLRLRRTG